MQPWWEKLKQKLWKQHWEGECQKKLWTKLSDRRSFRCWVVQCVSMRDTIIGYIKECVRNIPATKGNTGCASLKSNAIDTKELVRDSKGECQQQFCTYNDSISTLERRAIKMIRVVLVTSFCAENIRCEFILFYSLKTPCKLLIDMGQALLIELTARKVHEVNQPDLKRVVDYYNSIQWPHPSSDPCWTLYVEEQLLGQWIYNQTE